MKTETESKCENDGKGDKKERGWSEETKQNILKDFMKKC